MPFPSSGLVTLRPDLAQSLELFDLAADRAGFIGMDVLSVIEVAKASGNFGIIPLEQLLQSPDTTRSPGSGYARGRFSFKPSTYATTEHGAEEPVDDNEATLYDSYFKAEQVSAGRALDILLRGYEQRVATLVQNTANVGSSAGASVVWSTHASATPIEDVETAIQAVYASSGLWPNALAMHRTTFRHLRQCQEIVNRVKYSGFVDPRAGKLQPQDIAQVFDIERILVAGSSKNTANEGQNASLSPLWDKTKVLVFRGDWSEDPKRPCLGRTFHWAEDGSSIGGTMESYPEPQTRSTVIRTRQQTAEQILYANAAALITSCL